MPNLTAPTTVNLPKVNLPLSGDVTQAINPWKWVFDWAGSTFSLINVNLGRSANPELEQEILEEVGSYGRQLGRIGEAMQVLVDRLDRSTLTTEERHAIEAFEVQLREINELKGRQR
ncbi:hypothetical protein NUH88_09565 [Nisaea acidiphila]|uniref:Uncharacterized protein n=1 Tax=Nisaea acidiphila TaxID=1862145 RepID=A0A9J7AX38_9PROT|nr:hypothetical protein [Nisaea acidiphila]UUX51935.1 hypothetical protein NUH88_09565 [Nisaea acidiphila]